MSLSKKKKPEIIIYSKWCLHCEEAAFMVSFDEWCLHKGLTYEVHRTAYRPWWHKKAVGLWASAAGITEEEAKDYPSFVVWKGIKTIEEFARMIKREKDKSVKEGKTKSDVQRLPKTKRDSREDSMADPVSETPVKNEEKVSE